MGVGLSPLPLAATRLPPPPLADPGLCSVGRRGSLAYGSPPRPPGLLRARRSACGWPACCALRFAPARGPPLRSSRSVVGRPPAGALSRPRLRRGLPPPSSALWSFLRSGGLASSQFCAWGAGGARLRAPARPGGSPLGSRPAPLRSALLRGPWGSVVVWASPLPPPARPPPLGAPGGPGPVWVGLRPPARFAVGSPRGSRFSRPSPSSSPGGGGPPGPAFQPGCQS